MTQEELQVILKSQGVVITQATLSRDMRELNIIKKRENGRSFYSFLQEKNEENPSNLRTQLEQFVVKVASSSVMVVVHTHLGEADLLANALDELVDQGVRTDILGTLAGADTLLITCVSESAAQALCAEIADVL